MKMLTDRDNPEQLEERSAEEAHGISFDSSAGRIVARTRKYTTNSRSSRTLSLGCGFPVVLQQYRGVPQIETK
jgi:hypothetical protein